MARARPGSGPVRSPERTGSRALNERIGELLVKESLLTTEQLRKAREEAKTAGGRLGAQITKLGFLQENELSDFVAKQYGVPGINLDDFEVDPSVIQLIPEEVALKHGIMPVNRAGSIQPAWITPATWLGASGSPALAPTAFDDSTSTVALDSPRLGQSLWKIAAFTFPGPIR